MDEKLQKMLKQDHPELFELLYIDEEPDEETKDRIEDGMGLSIEWFGIECDDGWYDLIDTLCDTIDMLCQREKDKIPQVHQIKEKFAGLRFYLGGIHTKYADRISGAVSMAEKMSYNICEKCGTTEDVTVDEGGWIKTKCKKCREEEKTPLEKFNDGEI